jgi:hypothetical protein
MKPMSDLLRDAAADPPPPRLDVDDVVAAGRRRQHRRNGGWALVAAVAVAAAIGVPQIARPPAGDPAPAAMATSSAGPQAGPEFFTFTFRGYTAGRFQVSDPYRSGLEGETAFIGRAGTTERFGALQVFRPGVVPRDFEGAQRIAVEPVGGRPAEVQQWPPGSKDVEQLSWQYADGSWAVVRAGLSMMSRAEMRSVAEGFTPGERRPVTVGVRFGSVPAGYRVVEAAAAPADPERLSALSLVPEETAVERLARPDRGGPETGPRTRSVQVLLAQPDGEFSSRPTAPTCHAADNLCEMWLADGRTQVTVSFSGGVVDLTELRTMLGSATVADPGDVRTWYPVSDAIPAPAQPPLR